MAENTNNMSNYPVGIHLYCYFPLGSIPYALAQMIRRIDQPDIKLHYF